MTERLIFMGTPDFAVPSLEKLHQVYEVVAVVTQPDRPKGRGRKMVSPPVKQVAEAAGLTILQSASLRAPEVVETLRALKPDLIVVAAFGQILRPNVLDLPPHGCLNVHASLLPRWRGAAPVNAAIRAGDTETGVTIMQMDPGLDTGPMLRKRAIPITPQHTAAILTQELADLGAALLIETLPDWLAGKITPEPQDDSLATLAPRIKKGEGQINWHQRAVEIERHVRAFDPWPGTYTFWQQQRLKIISVSLMTAQPPAGLAPGQIFRHGKEVAAATAEGAIILEQIQLAGKRPVTAQDFIHGVPDFVGAIL